MKRPLGPLLSLLLGLVTASPAETTVDRAREGEARQGQIQTDSRGLVAQLDAMMDEYERNGLSGEEMKTFRGLRALLSHLSDQEMQSIRGTLQQAVAKNDPPAALRAIGEAYAAQKGVLGEFKRALAEHQRNQEALQLSREAAELADRQAANLQTGIQTAQWSLAGKHDAAEEETSLNGQSAEQMAIGEDLKLLREKLRSFGKNSEDKAQAERFAKGLAESEKVESALAAAAKALDEKQVFNAVTAQKTARDEMRQMARTIAPPRDEAEALRQATEQLDKLIAQQREIQRTAEAAKGKPLEQFVAEQLKNPQSPLAKAVAKGKVPAAQAAQSKEAQSQYKSQQRENEAQLPGLENRQGDVVSQAESLSQEIAPVAKPVAEALKAAIPSMQAARAAANEKLAEPAAQASTQALAALQAARTEVERRLAAAEKAKAAEGNPLAQLQNVQKAAQELMKEQAAVAPGAAPQQKALAAKAQQLQQKAAAAAVAPPAAAALAKAAANMQQAAAAPNAPAQQQAMQNLAQANQQIGQQIAQMQAAQAAAANAAQALSALAQIIAEQQKLEFETGSSATRPLLLALAPRQQTIADEAGKLPAPPDPKLLASAVSHMAKAKSALEQAEGKAAAPEEQLALKDLYVLQDQLQAQAPAAPDPQAQANAAAAVAQAQAQAAQAAAALAAGAPATAPLKAAAAAAGAAAAQPGALPPAAKQAARDAAAALSKAAASPPAAAGAATAKAQQSLAQAAAALGQAQAGISPGPGAPMAGPPGPPGQGDSGDGSQQPGGKVDAQPGGAVAGQGLFVGLPERDRATIRQAHSEKYPQQYAADVEQYLRNLSDEAGSR